MNIFTANSAKPLILGRQGENEATTLQFPIAKWIEAYGSGTFSLVHQRATDTAPYPVTITSDANYVYWEVSSSDVAVKGYGKAELRYTVGDVIAKSEIFTTLSAEALGQTTDPPEAWQAWVDEVEGFRDDAVEAKEAIEDMTATGSVSSTTGTPTITVTKTTVSGHENLDFAFSGIKGETGTGVPTGGTSGQVLKKRSATDYDFEWGEATGVSSFDDLTDRPSYNGSTMTSSTDIPEVKTSLWDSKAAGNHNHDSRYYTESEVDTLLAAKEATANKVTELSSESTDTQYPSAKAVYDELSTQSSQIAAKNDNVYLSVVDGKICVTYDA